MVIFLMFEYTQDWRVIMTNLQDSCSIFFYNDSTFKEHQRQTYGLLTFVVFSSIMEVVFSSFQG